MSFLYFIIYILYIVCLYINFIIEAVQVAHDFASRQAWTFAHLHVCGYWNLQNPNAKMPDSELYHVGWQRCFSQSRLSQVWCLPSPCFNHCTRSERWKWQKNKRKKNPLSQTNRFIYSFEVVLDLYEKKKSLSEQW